MSTQNQAPDQKETPSVSYRRALGGLTLTLLASWLLMMAPLPYSLLAGLTAIAAGVFLVIVVMRGFREGRRTMVLVAVIFGIPAVAMMVLTAATSAVFYQPMKQMQDCQAAAITEQARTACEQEAQNSVTSWMGDLLGG